MGMCVVSIFIYFEIICPKRGVGDVLKAAQYQGIWQGYLEKQLEMLFINIFQQMNRKQSD